MSTDSDNRAAADVEDGPEFPKRSFEDWRKEAAKLAPNGDLSALETTTRDGLRIRPLYTRADSPEPDVSGFPGLPPYTRGRLPFPAGPRLYAFADHPDPAEANRLLSKDLEHGATGVWLAFDSSLRRGSREDGRQPDGIMPSDSAALRRLLKGVDLSRTAIFLDAGNSALATAAVVASLAASGPGTQTLRGCLGCDPLGTMAREGIVRGGIEAAFDGMAEAARWTAEEAPQLRSIAVSTLPYHDAGATAAEELACALAVGVSYLRELADRGFLVNRAGRQLAFVFAVGRDIFWEIAKLRAARRLWTQVARICGAPPQIQAMQLYAVTSHHTLTVLDPWVNLIRKTVEGFSAIAGGADGVTVLPFDRLLPHRTDRGRRLAINTFRILKDESGAAGVVDPAGGSWHLESITEELSRKAWEVFQEIEAMGGARRAWTQGWLRQRLARSSERERQLVREGTLPVTGVSRYDNPDQEAPQADASPSGPQGVKTRQLEELKHPLSSEGTGWFEDWVEAVGNNVALPDLCRALWKRGKDEAIKPAASHREGEEFERRRREEKEKAQP